MWPLSIGVVGGILYTGLRKNPVFEHGAVIPAWEKFGFIQQTEIASSTSSNKF
jgi:hypothetical protein